MRKKRSARDADVLLGEDWVAPDIEADSAISAARRKRGVIALNRSPLARKIITFNLMALIVLVSGILYLNPGRDSLIKQRGHAFITHAGLLAELVEARLPEQGRLNGAEIAPILADVVRGHPVEAFVLGDEGTVLAQALGAGPAPVVGSDKPSNLITGFLNSAWDGLASLLSPNAGAPKERPNVSYALRLSAELEPESGVRMLVEQGVRGQTIFAVAAPLVRDGQAVATLALVDTAGELDTLIRAEREQVLQMFVIAIIISIGLSLVLASTIANPLSDLAAAAEIGRDKNARKMNPGRVRIPDLTARPDEIGRLSGALRGMVTALYDRIEANEQFAADVAHEIKNPLASLRSAVGTLRVAKRADQRDKLLDVIDHDVRRLDRLVSDISNASRLDSELVKEEEELFDLRGMLENLTEYLGQEAGEKGVDFISDLPDEKIAIHGLEARLAQVFVNLITNAMSFCEEGDAVRVWVRRRENRVLVVVEDTGPGIPDQALTKIFNRFYSERPEGQFGDHSGLGLAISKQIIEAHGGVIWAENIRPTDADLTSEPLGARFVVGLPV